MRAIFCAIFTFIAISSFSQNYVDLLKVNYQNTPQNNFDTGSGSSNVSEYSISLTLPIVISEKVAFITGGTMGKFTMNLTPTAAKTTLSSYLIKAGLNIQHNDKVSGTYLLLPKLASDFEGDLSKSDFQFGALALLKFQKKENFKYKLGLYYNPDLFGNFFVPILGLYSKTKKWEVDMTIPVSANANYKLAEKWRIGADFRAVVKSFNLHRYYYSSPFAVPQKDNSEYVHQATNEISSYLSYELKKGFILKGQVGYSIGRSYRVYQKGDQMDFGISAFKFGDNRQQLNPDFADGLVARAEFIYRFYTD